MTVTPGTQALKSERGIALIAALLLLVVLSALAAGLAASGKVELAIGDNEAKFIKTRAAAEAGLNRGVILVKAALAASTTTLPALLSGPDGAVSADNPSASVNADNGSLVVMLGGSSPWAVSDAAPGYSYTVRIYDDDDPALYDTAPTSAQLTAMGENGSSVTDANDRLVIRATGYGPGGTVVMVQSMIVPQDLPAIIVDGDLTVAGNSTVSGAKGSVHANHDLFIDNMAVSISQNATASNNYTAPDGWTPGGDYGGSRPKIDVPDVNAADYYNQADLILTNTGKIIRRSDGEVKCDASSDANACRSHYGWKYQGGGNWDMNYNSPDVEATYYVQGDATVSGNPGSPAHPLSITIIAEGNINITGNPNFRPEASSSLQFVTNKDLKLNGNITEPLTVEGRSLVREQLFVQGNATLSGQIIVQNVPSISTLVTGNSISGSMTINYNGTLGTLTYTISGWREGQ